jgi:hypothetical protein
MAFFTVSRNHEFKPLYNLNVPFLFSVRSRQLPLVVEDGRRLAPMAGDLVDRLALVLAI